MSDDFKADWDRFYPGCNPVAHQMRGAPLNWIRFHSLPESKRYPETDEERSLLLARQFTLADEVIGHGASCWMIQNCWPTQPDEICDTEDFWPSETFGLQPSFLYEFDPDDPEADDRPWTARAGTVAWHGERFAKVLSEVAEDRLHYILWMSRRTGAVFAPYDGGVDLFLPSDAEVERLRATYHGWLSKHPLGL